MDDRQKVYGLDSQRPVQQIKSPDDAEMAHSREQDYPNILERAQQKGRPVSYSWMSPVSCLLRWYVVAMHRAGHPPVVKVSNPHGQNIR